MGAVNVLGGAGKMPDWSVHRDNCDSRINVNIGATGAPTVVGAPGWTITRTGVGTYTGTFPAMPAAAKSIPIMDCGILLSAAKTVTKVIITAFSETAGTFGFTLAQSAATAAEAANGDILWFEIKGSISGTP